MSRSSLKNIFALLDAEQENIPPEKAFLNDFKRSIEMCADKERRPPSRTFKPSSMNCMRQSYYQLTGAEQDPVSSNYSLVNICNSGTDIHERLQRAVAQMRENGMDCDYVDVAEFVKSRELPLDIVDSGKSMETKLYSKQYNVSFLCDGIIRYHGHYYILELKTESIYKWQNRQGVDPMHYNQGAMYSMLLGLPEVLFIYINRDVMDMKAYLYEPSKELILNLQEYMRDCNSYVALQSVPPVSGVLKKACVYCEYHNMCNKDG